MLLRSDRYRESLEDTLVHAEAYCTAPATYARAISVRAVFALLRSPVETTTRFATLIITVLVLLCSPTCQASPNDLSSRAKSEQGIPPTRARIIVDRETLGSRSFIVIKVSVPTDSTITAFSVKDPARIVVDFEGTRTKHNEVLSVPTNPVVKQIRLGAHPEKLRIVLDLYRSAPEDFDNDISPRQITIRLPENSNTSTSADTTRKDEKQEAANTPAPTAAPTIAIAALTERPEPVHTSLPVSTSTAVTEETPTARPTSTPKVVNTSEAIPTLSSSPPPTATTRPTVTASTSQTDPAIPTPLVTKSPTAIKTATPTKAVKATQTPLPTKTPTPTATASYTPTATKTATATRTPPRTPTPKAQPSSTSVPGYDSKKVLPMPASTSTSSLVGDVSVASPPVAQGGKLLVMGYRFDYLNPGRIPILKINLLRTKAQAQISKVDTKTYRIVIPNCGLVAAQLALPQFPPADFIGFSMVAAQELEGRVEITITVEPGVTLGTFVRDNEIYVKRL